MRANNYQKRTRNYEKTRKYPEIWCQTTKVGPKIGSLVRALTIILRLKNINIYCQIVKNVIDVSDSLLI